LHEITEGRMRGKPTRGRRRNQMLHDLANDGALKRQLRREGWRQDSYAFVKHSIHVD